MRSTYIYEYIVMSKINCLKSLLKNVIAIAVFTRVVVTKTAPNLPLQMKITTYTTNNVNFAEI